MSKKFFIFFLIILLSLFVQVQVKANFLNTVDLVLASLITISFFATLPELLFFIFFSAFILNWLPGMNWELILYVFIPLATSLLKTILPWRPWASNLLLVLLSLNIFYLVSQGVYPFRSATIVLALDVVLSLLFSGLLFWVFKEMLGYRPKTFRHK